MDEMNASRITINGFASTAMQHRKWSVTPLRASNNRCSMGGPSS